MILLDTNIVSVLLSPDHGDFPHLSTWQESCSDQEFRISAVTRAEISYGVAILPSGARRTRLAEAVDRFFATVERLVLPFGIPEAELYGRIVASRRAQGRPIAVLDAQIAATARACGASLATRNTRDFHDCGVGLINPYGEGTG